MWHSKLKNQIKIFSIIFLGLMFDNTISGQLFDYPVTLLPDQPITQFYNYAVTQSTNYRITQSANKQADLSTYLPTKSEIGTWQPTGSPEKAVGEDLFVLINGGAEIYHEYGFKQVIMQSYENVNEKSINLEIYEMENSASAFGIYSFKTSSRGKEIHLGDKALLEDYYLNCWKDNFLITVTGFDSEPETIAGLMVIAKTVDSKIKTRGKLPELVEMLPTENLNPLNVKYLTGTLGLFNNSDFGAANIFGMKQGVLADYDKYRLFIFKYDDSNESEHWLKTARDSIQSNADFVVYNEPVPSDVTVLIKGDQRIFLKCCRQYLIVVVGTAMTKAREIMGKVQANIAR